MVANSTTHAEFTAIADAAPCALVCNKTLSIDKIKYIEKKVLDVKEWFDKKLLKTISISTTDQLAHILTKPLPGV